MAGAITKELMRLMHKEIYEEKRDCFLSLGDRGIFPICINCDITANDYILNTDSPVGE